MTAARVSDRVRVHPLVAVLLVAAAVRLPLAFLPNVHFSDEIFQVLEPAWRLLGHDSVVTWEWREGTRAWLLPMLMAAPVAIGNALLPDGNGAFYAARLLAASASLSIVASAYLFGARVSARHGLVAAFVAAIWFELIYFAPHTLSEPIATAAILPAAWLVGKRTASRRQLAAAGALFAFAFVVRFHYAPAMAVVVAMACWREMARVLPLALGAGLVLALAALADLSQGAVPFGWMVESLRHNVVLGRASGFGEQPATAYVGNFYAMWSVLLIPLGFAIGRGWRHAPALWWMAVVNIAVHSAIGHKEYRFIFLSVAALIVVAAIGSTDWIVALRSRAALRRVAQPLMLALWIAASVSLALAPSFRNQWTRGLDAAQIASDLRGDAAMCAVAFLDVPHDLMVGRERLAGAKPIYHFAAADFAASGGAAASLVRKQAGFNRVVARRDAAPVIPGEFAEASCGPLYGVPVCIYARPGGCDAGPASPFLLNDALVRIGQ